MVTVHEAGHFFGARISGITVETFAIGWGRAIKRWRKNGIEYRINIFPLGGYCKLKGAEDLIASQERHESEMVHVSSGSIFAAHPLKRILTYLAGPLMNLIFAALLFIPFFMLPYSSFSDPSSVIVSSEYPLIYGESENAAERGGMKSGDTILSLDGHEVRNFQDISTFMTTYDSHEPIAVNVLRDGSTLELSILPQKTDNRYLLGVSSALTPILSEVDPISPESMAGMKAGDTILSVDEKATPYMADVLSAYLNAAGKMRVEVLHEDGTTEICSFIPERTTEGNVIAHITFKRDTMYNEGLSLPSGVLAAMRETGSMISETLQLFSQLVTGKMEAGSSLAGPLRISYVIGATFSAGMRSFLQLLAMVSISLGIANLIPLPALDGGSIVLSVIEWVRRKRLPVGIYIKYQSVGLVILSLLILFVLFSDARFFLS